MANFSKSNVPQFSVEVYQNEFLPEGGREVNGIITVTSTGGGTTGGVPLAGASGPGRATGVSVCGSVHADPSPFSGGEDRGPGTGDPGQAPADLVDHGGGQRRQRCLAGVDPYRDPQAVQYPLGAGDRFGVGALPCRCPQLGAQPVAHDRLLDRG